MNIFLRFKTAIGTFKSLYYNVRKNDMASCGKNVILENPMKVTKPCNIYLGNNVAIRGFFTFISHTGRLYVKDNVDISQHLTVVTGNHTIHPPLDMWQIECNHTAYGDKELDIIIEEDVWIGINVTILPGVTIGRGSIIGACSLVNKSIPPYSIAVGNPCKVVKRKFSKNEIYKREQSLYPASKRLASDVIENLFR